MEKLKQSSVVRINKTNELGVVVGSSGEELYVLILQTEIVGPFLDKYHVYVTVTDNGALLVDIRRKQTVAIHEAEWVSEIPTADYEKIVRMDILSKVENYYELFHSDRNKHFDAEKTAISYGGRIFDEKEMRNLVDSSLDFWLTAGRFNKQFEKEFAEFLGVRYALLTNSGSSANLLAFSALTSPKLGDRRVMPGDEVITVAAGFPTTVAPIIQNGAIPVFIDVELGTYNIMVDRIEEAITPKTKAIMVAHTMGNPFELDKVMEIANKYHLWVVEDNCDALGSTFNGKLTGTYGHIGTSSFYPPHHMTMGEGGAVYTNHALLKTIIESFRDWGRDCWCPSGCDNTCKKRFAWELGSLPKGYDHKYTYSHIGYNLRVTDMQAAVGIEQLKKVPSFIQARKNNFNRLYEGLKELEPFFILPRPTENSDPSWFGFILTLKDDVNFTKNEIVDHLEKKRIQTRMLFAGNLIRQPAYQHVNYRIHGNLTNTDKIMHDTFLVGVYPGLTNEMIDYVANTIKQFVINKQSEEVTT
ncbi:lipopolysaccharide biosynthesis protein RfbH [Paenibacillus popilliae]|uniref:Predicted pyridoxal phosphate-dependent enzyme n=1 Tax=Paenibacillus popilliae ATCC 14706 TaxID=1212764 RepID=M9L8M6_PAEPP|nr:lipopolysaccharide biosynthesis protein RfbH [Paenibacillus popilliae]GAC41572.1 predicted pyridoxal phosphate-dependent enzyme [Paenibacillus popilliae ATCC 14706]